MYIIDSACISPQLTFDDRFFHGEVRSYVGDRYNAIEPQYGPLIPGGLLRRMGKAVRMGVGAGLPLLQKWKPDGIILGTANGGLEDCLKFLNQIVEYDEGTLTPTNFVQSTPNAVAGNLALMNKTTGYNTTHVHKGLAFEAALLDAMLLFGEGKITSVLAGGVDEISDYNHNIDFLSGSFKTGEYSSETLLGSGTPGSVNGEGATMFLLHSEKQGGALGRIADLWQTSYWPGGDITTKIIGFLKANALSPEDMDSVILGLSGDVRTDHIFENVKTKLFGEANIYTYKNLVGDYPTASAWATWLGVQLLVGKQAPEQCTLQMKNPGKPKNILIYNHYKAAQHSLILLCNAD